MTHGTVEKGVSAMCPSGKRKLYYVVVTSLSDNPVQYLITCTMASELQLKLSFIGSWKIFNNLQRRVVVLKLPDFATLEGLINFGMDEKSLMK